MFLMFCSCSFGALETAQMVLSGLSELILYKNMFVQLSRLPAEIRTAMRSPDLPKYQMEIPSDWVSENRLLPEEPMNSTKKLFVKMQLGFHTDADGERRKSIEFKTYTGSVEGWKIRFFTKNPDSKVPSEKYPSFLCLDYLGVLPNQKVPDNFEVLQPVFTDLVLLKDSAQDLYKDFWGSTDVVQNFSDGVLFLKYVEETIRKVKSRQDLDGDTAIMDMWFTITKRIQRTKQKSEDTWFAMMAQAERGG